MGGLSYGWTRRLLSLVEDGVEPVEDLYRLTEAWVPMGHAYRERERRSERFRAAHPRRDGRPGVSRPVEPITVEAHRVGARVVLRRSLRNLVRAGLIIRTERGYIPAPHTPKQSVRGMNESAVTPPPMTALSTRDDCGHPL